MSPPIPVVNSTLPVQRLHSDPNLRHRANTSPSSRVDNIVTARSRTKSFTEGESFGDLKVDYMASDIDPFQKAPLPGNLSAPQIVQPILNSKLTQDEVGSIVFNAHNSVWDSS